jgi:predicted component of type VI protein secretion system
VNAFAVNTKPICYTFFDCDQLSAISITTSDLARAASCAIEAARIRDTERIVAIFAGDDYAYRLALIYKVLIEQTGWEACAFRDRAAAVSWLRSRSAAKHGIAVDVE